jgi:HD-GYP domain-containing protein (c-di-GMP phosphodiesterase class II)
MELESQQELTLSPTIAEALAQLDGALKANMGMSIALMNSAGERLYPEADPAEVAEESALRKLCSQVAAEEGEASADFGDQGTAHAVPVSDTHDMLGALIGYPTNGKTPPPAESTEAEVLGILRGLATVTAELSAKDAAIDSLADELDRRYEDLTLVYDLAGNMEIGSGLEASLERIFNAALAHMDLGIIIVFNPLTQRRKMHHLTENGYKPTRKERAALYELEAHARATVLSSGESWCVNGLDGDPVFSHLQNICSHVLCVPVQVSGVGAGAITAIKLCGKERFFMGDVKLISALARQVAIVIRNARLFSEVRSLFLNLVKSLISIVEAKHKYTRGHSERVNRISCFLGKHLGLRRHALEVLHWASLFHDVGKISVPDAILNKPGKLTDEEFDAIKQHPAVGFNVLSHIEQLREALPGIRHHHEKLDGSGYPDGLSGDEIPLMAKIIAVADVYDALTSSRSYRPAMSIDKALAIMHEGDGTHFDPRVLKIFVRKHDDIAQMLVPVESAAVVPV